MKRLVLLLLSVGWAVAWAQDTTRTDSTRLAVPDSSELAVVIATRNWAGAPVDSLRHAGYWRRQVGYDVQYPFVDYSRNYIQYKTPEALRTFFTALGSSHKRKVRVVHIGDSHIQADVYTGAVRNNLQRIFGPGGRGWVFPYRVARTHPPYDYRSYAAGAWVTARNMDLYPMLGLGINGISARTEDSTAGFKLVFSDSSMVAGNTLLRTYTPKSKNAFALKAYYAQDQYVLLDPAQRAGGLHHSTLLPQAPHALEVWMHKGGDSARRYFEFYGMSVETPDDRGMLYHSMGINGAHFASLFKQNLMHEQLAEMQPDLVFLDIAGNEFYFGLNGPDFEAKLRTAIDLVRKASPTSSIIVGCSQDMYRRYYHNITEGKQAAAIAKAVALERGCGFFDYYHIAGGPQSMLQWQQYRLAKSDRVHLTHAGYVIKGELLTNAYLASYSHWLAGATSYLDTTVLAASVNPANVIPAHRMANTAPVLRPYTPPPGNRHVYTVKNGDVLGTIAEAHHVGVYQLMVWNNLYSSRIYAGQQLVLYLPKGVRAPAEKKTVVQPVKGKAATNNTQTKVVNKNVPKARSTYTVLRGDSLWTIARKFKTTVDTLKQLNDLSSDQLRPGMQLRVP